MDLVTVINNKFCKSALNLIKSYRFHSYDKKIFVYWFGEYTEEFSDLEKDKNISLVEVPNVIEHAHNPRAFFYKSYAISDAIEKTETFIYSDSTNCFVSDAKQIHKDLDEGSLFLAYQHPLLTNEYWTTERCFSAIEDSYGSEFMPQYWAGFQAYEKTNTNYQMIKELYNLSLDSGILLPDTTVKMPDGKESKCIEHRQDQSILSILIHKYDKHQRFDFLKSDRYGDWQTVNNFDNRQTLNPNSKNRILMPRESKFGFYRFLE